MNFPLRRAQFYGRSRIQYDGKSVTQISYSEIAPKHYFTYFKTCSKTDGIQRFKLFLIKPECVVELFELLNCSGWKRKIFLAEMVKDKSILV